MKIKKNRLNKKEIYDIFYEENVAMQYNVPSSRQYGNNVLET